MYSATRKKPQNHPQPLDANPSNIGTPNSRLLVMERLIGQHPRLPFDAPAAEGE
jgi:hypothetical protein